MDITPFDILEVRTQILEEEEKEACMLRKQLKEKGVFFINLMGSPGAGKTTLLERTVAALGDSLKIGVIEADADGDVDAHRMAALGVKVLQVHTGGSCHMDVSMTKNALEKLGVDGLDLIFLENVGNLVCPAEFDVGAHRRVMILSTPEGHDKPLKYPLMFEVSDAVLVNKTDVASVFDFDMAQFEKNVRLRNENAPIIPVSSLTGEGFDAWISLLEKLMSDNKM